ncbi:MAG: nitroreductase family protein [Candidatus Bathyarchaeota archaeon]|nr:MAG: nitroreductase family protein [Candidatus Bathyarchaeum tardum]WNZ30348.1 MAG: nitroreductase family protein [Candidatus Bathyarchaeota archaeon]
MSIFEVISNRRSIRSYEDKEIPKQVLDQILEAGRLAPSAVNKQPYRFIVVTKSELKKEMKAIFSRFLEKAPVVIVGCANVKSRLTGKWAVVDTTIALQNMVLAAWSLGAGSCWIGSFNEQKTKQALKIPQDWKVVALISLGYPAETPNARKKKSAEELLGYNQF